ncbi:MAG: sulfite exporter TauE/SafE family protein [Microscillaceae bacterium]
MIFTYGAIMLISIIIGFINTLVGSGSLVMLPLLIAMGLPANIANGTNRVAVFFQSLVGAYSFWQKKKIPLGRAAWSIVPCVFGAILGAYIATQISPKALNDFIGILLIVMLGLILVRPNRWMRKENANGEHSKRPLAIFIMFLIGIYGGFIQAGVGIFLLAGLVLGVHYSLPYANAIKLIIVAFYAFPVLLVFVWQNQVDWFYGIFTALGQGLGAFLGARFMVYYPNAEVWIYRLLVIIVLGAIIHFYELWRYLGLF